MIYRFFKGRVALYALLKAAGIGAGDDVIVPGFTCVVVANAIRYVGARPVFVDIDPDSYNLDPAKVEAALTGATKAVIVQHTFGIPAAMDQFVALTQARGLLLIEDCCHAFGATYGGREVGSFGAAAFFSSQWSKPVTTGLGGWAVVNDPSLMGPMDRLYPNFRAPPGLAVWRLRAQYLAYTTLVGPALFWPARAAYRKLSWIGLAVASSAPEELAGDKPADYDWRMSPWQSRLLTLQLADRLAMIQRRRHQTALCERLMRRHDLSTLHVPPPSAPVLLSYPVRVADKPGALAMARQRRVPLGDWFSSPLHPVAERWHVWGYAEGSCPIAEELARHVVQIPLGPKVTDVEIGKAVAIVRAHV